MSRRKPVRKRIVIMPSLSLEVVPEVKGQAPSRVPDSSDSPIPLDLLQPLHPAVRATLVDVLADIAHGQFEVARRIDNLFATRAR